MAKFKWLDTVELVAGSTIAIGDRVVHTADDQYVDPQAADGVAVLGIAQNAASVGETVKIKLFRRLQVFKFELVSQETPDLSSAATRLSLIGGLYAAGGPQTVDLNDAGTDGKHIFKLWQLEEEKRTGDYFGWFSVKQSADQSDLSVA
jgi:hypothetical protein